MAELNKPADEKKAEKNTDGSCAECHSADGFPEGAVRQECEHGTFTRSQSDADKAAKERTEREIAIAALEKQRSA